MTYLILLAQKHLFMYNVYIYFRKHALEVERSRAADIAAMPPPPPDPLKQLNVAKTCMFDLLPFNSLR